MSSFEACKITEMTASEMGKKGGQSTFEIHGSDHFRRIAAMRKNRRGGRPRLSTKPILCEGCDVRFTQDELMRLKGIECCPKCRVSTWLTRQDVQLKASF
jgi:hypothetical protein